MLITFAAVICCMMRCTGALSPQTVAQRDTSNGSHLRDQLALTPPDILTDAFTERLQVEENIPRVVTPQSKLKISNLSITGGKLQVQTFLLQVEKSLLLFSFC